MAEAKKPIYFRRHPEKTDYYRIIENWFEDFFRYYPEHIKEKFGHLRQEILKAIYAFLDCGLPENGLARVFCDACGHDFFIAFSCRQRGICPSCSTKRSILFGEKIAELVKPIAHVHITFTIPKLLRAYFRRNRTLLKLLVQSANWAVKEYFSQAIEITDGYTGGVYYIQTQGALLNHHPHVHGLALPGIIKDGLFHEQKKISRLVISRLFRARLLKVLQAEGIIRQEIIDLLMSWNHNSGFNVHVSGRINGTNGKAIENVARYMSRPAISTERVKYDPESGTVTVYEKKPQIPGDSKIYPLDEFFALLVAHIPAPYESCTYYYGLYSSSYRGKENREQKQELEAIQSNGKTGTVEGKMTSTWARLIHKIFEIDPLKCNKCGSRMRFAAFIIRAEETKKILDHIGEPTIRPPPLMKPHRALQPGEDSEFIDYIPPVEAYVIDTIYSD